MTQELDDVYKRLASLSTEVSNLREGYIILNSRYTESLATLKVLTLHATAAASRSATAAELARQSTTHAATAAKEAAIRSVIEAAEAAADAAAAAAAHQAEKAAKQSAAKRPRPRKWLHGRPLNPSRWPTRLPALQGAASTSRPGQLTKVLINSWC